MTRLEKQIQFIKELEKLKVIYRQNRVLTPDRFENSAEHSWHIVIMALILEDTCCLNELDMMKVMKMLLIHDIVEIDAGDAFLYDDVRRTEAETSEVLAANRIFGLLPENQREDYLSLWQEFEEHESKEARYAKAMDALQPLLNHSLTGLENTHNLTKSQVMEKKIFIKDVSEKLWEVALEAIETCVSKGLFRDE